MSRRVARIKGIVEELQRQAEEILKLADRASQKYTPDPEAHIKLIGLYQSWYRKGRELIAIDPARASEFADLYDKRDFSLYPGQYPNIKTFLDDPSAGAYGNFKKYFTTQLALLVSLPDSLEIRELDLKRTLAEELSLTLLDEAEQLLKREENKSAGLLMGTALKYWLKTSIEAEEISLPQEEGIYPLIDELGKAGVIDSRDKRLLTKAETLYEALLKGEQIEDKDIGDYIEGIKEIIEGSR